MVKRIDLFIPPFSQYGVLQRLTTDIYEALQRAKVQSRMLEAEKENPKPFLDALFGDKPECTLSLNGLLPDDSGSFFCDMVKIPHVACLVDSPNQFAALTQSKRNVITCPDIYATHFFRGLNFQNVLFFPHGVNPDLQQGPEKKKYDVVFLASCIDFETIRANWKHKYPKKLCNALDEAAEITLSDQTTPYVEAFVDALGRHMSKEEPLDPKQFQLMQILDDLEMYIRGKDRVELIKGIKDATIDIFGAGKEGGGWEKYLDKGHSNVRLNPAIPFEKALEVMGDCKILLNSCPWIKNGGHERIFSGIAKGALVLTSENPYMAERFDNGDSIAYYYHGRWDEVNDQVHSYLEDEEKRRQVIKKGRKIVMSGHTWDHRVATLLQELPPLLENIKKQTT